MSKHVSMSLRVAALALLAASAAVQAEPVVVVNAANTANLDDEALARIFLRQLKAFPDGTATAPVSQKDGPLSEEFRTKLLKKNTAQYKAYWAQHVFTGGAKPLPEMDGDEAVLKHVAETPGGIGYVDSGKTRAGVRVIKR